MESKHIFTSESVSEGHPDKVADQISDAILDACLTQDPEAKVACENLITSQHLTIAGELQTTAVIDAPVIARQVLKDIGYNHINIGFDCKIRMIPDTPTDLLRTPLPFLSGQWYRFIPDSATG